MPGACNTSRNLAATPSLDEGFSSQFVGLVMHGGHESCVCIMHHASCIMHHACTFVSPGVRSDKKRNPDMVLVKPLRPSRGSHENSQDNLWVKGNSLCRFLSGNPLRPMDFTLGVQLSSMTMPDYLKKWIVRQRVVRMEIATVNMRSRGSRILIMLRTQRCRKGWSCEIYTINAPLLLSILKFAPLGQDGGQRLGSSSSAVGLSCFATPCSLL